VTSLWLRLRRAGGVVAEIKAPACLSRHGISVCPARSIRQRPVKSKYAEGRWVGALD
jgi:hypothetical protein